MLGTEWRNSEIAETLIEIAEQYQIPVFLYDSYIQKENVVSVIATDNYAIATDIAAEKYGTVFAGKTREKPGRKIAILSGNQANSSHTRTCSWLPGIYTERISGN